MLSVNHSFPDHVLKLKHTGHIFVDGPPTPFNPPFLASLLNTDFVMPWVPSPSIRRCCFAPPFPRPFPHPILFARTFYRLVLVLPGNDEMHTHYKATGGWKRVSGFKKYEHFQYFIESELTVGVCTHGLLLDLFRYIDRR